MASLRNSKVICDGNSYDSERLFQNIQAFTFHTEERKVMQQAAGRRDDEEETCESQVCQGFVCDRIKGNAPRVDGGASSHFVWRKLHSHDVTSLSAQ